MLARTEEIARAVFFRLLGIAQLVERLVRNESGRNTLTLSQPLGCALPKVKLASRVYLTLSEMR